MPSPATGATIPQISVFIAAQRPVTLAACSVAAQAAQTSAPVIS
jgi:hypothetical protein